MPIIEHNQNSSDKPETVDTVKRGLEKLDLATKSKGSETAALAQQQQSESQAPDVVCRSMEQSIEILDIDPLSIDLPMAVKYLESQIALRKIATPESAKPALQKLNKWASQSKPKSDKLTVAKALNRLSALLLAEGVDMALHSFPGHNKERGGALWTDGRFTSLVAMVFRPIVVELVARWTQAEAPASVIHQLGSHIDANRAYLCVAYAAGIIVGTAPQVRSLVMAYFQKRAGPKCIAQLAMEGQGSQAAVSQMLAVALRLLRRMPEAADGVLAWDWQTSLLALMGPGYDSCVRILACECLSLVRGLTDSGRSQVLLQSMASDSASVAELRAWAVYGEQQFDLAADEQMIEQNRVGFKNGLWKQLDQSCNGDKEGQFTWLSDSDLSSCVANVGGVLLHAHDESATETSASGFVLTPTVSANVHEIALATSRREPVLLQGPPGSGKTSLVEWVAQRTGHELVTIHLSSSMDAKVLLGNYVTTQKAGDFEWRAGLLTTAVSEGRWVLIEDIDLAPADVVQTLVPLLESHTLFVASRGEAIRAHIRFRLFATLSTHARSSGSRAGVDGLLGSSIWTRVQIGPLEHEMPLVVAGVFPGLAPHAETLAAAFAQVAGAVAASSGASVGRSSAPVLSTRDLVKWCMRLQAYGANDAFRLFQEAVDAFAMREADYERWRTLIHRIGAVFTIAATRIDNFADQYAPDVSRVGSELRIGRARLPISGPSPDERMPFADTRHSRCLLERIAACVQLGEPVLLSGETGTGKTTVVQHLAALAGRSLAVFNLSQQSDSSDLLGGFRPVDIALVALQLREAFDLLFARTVSVRKNAAFLDSVRVAHARRDWRRLAGLFAAAVKMAQQVISKAKAETEKKTLAETIGSRKRARLTAETIGELDTEWKRFAERVESFDGLRGARMVFSFVEGALVTAARSGGWILLDEVNLAAAETLACLGGLLQAERTIVLAETGERIRCHPDFRLFACMNPANDVGKRDLPPGLRSSFAEFFVHPPDANADDLLAIIRAHLPANTPPAVCHRVIAFYRAAKRLAAEHQLVDGANQRPHYSLRTLTRSLTYARENAAAYSLKRALYDGLCMTFATQLAGTTQPVLLDELARVFEGDSLRQMLAHVPPMRNQDAVLVQGFWLPSLDSEVQAADSAYVMTASVEAKLRALSRAVMCGRYPVLIQGPTSAGKTSMVQHLARLTGHKFVRINNHEHTDLQEYLGAYASVDGRLVFQEGLLVRALREGHWLVLDELNLAPSDVLEALNRLLDDNRELVIPETQEIVRPHPHFMLFATQNPAGLYGGRKALSRAFRNRFVELHFDDIPERELQQIIVDSCQVPPSHAALLVGVYRGLTQTRAQTRIFEASHGFITLRDLFRWANRRATSKIELAEHGFMLLAERVRSEEEKAVVQRAIERVFFPSSTGAGSVRRANTIDIEALYSESRLQAMPEYQAFVRLNQKLATSVAWTSAMRRLFVLTALCLRFHEPVLLVGETGCGKTTVCQMLAQSLGRRLHIVNCHQNTESSDILGGQRPVRNRNALIAAARERLTNAGVKNAESIDSPDALDKITTHSTDDEMGLIGEARELLVRAQSLFAWHDGPLVQAMRQGDVFLMDELNLADDSVLERLNSVLEPSRTLVLAEQAGATTLAAHAGFEFVATMNPGGDYGKRELSPALRNRFTELWAPTTTDVDDLKMILVQRMHSVPEHVECARVILDFVAYLRDGIRVLLHPLSLRDYLFWADFIVRTRPLMDAGSCVVHGACLVLLDAIGTQGSLFNVSVRAPTAVKSECVARLCSMVGWDIASGGNASLRALGVVPARKLLDSGLASSLDIADLAALIVSRDHAVGVAPFFVCEGSLASTSDDLRNRISGFALDAPTTFDNLVKILRAMQVGKPLLLEGSPGVGKTTLVSTLARLAGHRLVRINLSDQTDLMDLFGSDLPVDGGFAWCDAPFLQALKQGDWVLLDEINLASQSVLEGLNSCLDHRGSVYISELDREFTLSPGFRLFAAQNPLGQGGGRKGLPRSFVNRFTQVYMDELARADLQVICDRMYAAHPSIADVLEFNWRMHSETMGRRSFGASGSPWEFNLRDVSRFMELALGASALDARAKPVADFVEMLYVHRMRTETDRKHVADLFLSVFNRPLSPSVPTLLMTEATLQVGGAVLERHQTNAQTSRLRILHSQLTYLESLMRCIEMRWMAILVGPAGCGKTSLVRWLASATGNQLVEFSMNAGVDTSEILGGFEQVDLQRHCTRLVRLLACVNEQALLCASFQDPQQVSAAKQMAELYHQAASATAMSSVSRLCTLAEEMAQLASCFAALSDLSAQILQQTQALAKLEVAGKFEWVDGVLVEALVNGHWLLIDRANLCSASVLDRLNGLLEPNGVLYVNEDPKRTQAIVPHPNFRIIMAVDPQYGELSRAMRNRGIEICVLPSGDSECLVGDQRAVARAIGVGAGLLSGPILPELTVTALVQQAMYVAERVQRGYVASNESGDKDSMLLVRAPGSPSEAAVSVAAWQAALLKMAASMASSSKLAATRMILAILATIPPSTTALSTACFHAIVKENMSSLGIISRLVVPFNFTVLIETLTRARHMLAQEAGIHAELLAAAPLCIALNSGIERILQRRQTDDSSYGLAALWHQALTDTLMFERERIALEHTVSESELLTDLRELVLQRPNVDISFVQDIFGLIDGCQRILDAWKSAVVEADESAVKSDLAQFVPALRSLHRLKMRIEHILSLDSRGDASELAVAFENLQPLLKHLLGVPGVIGQEAESLLNSSVDGLVLDASFSARVWQLEHPVTLADDEARVLEKRLLGAASLLALDESSDPVLRDAVTEALAMLFATASRKDQHLVRAAIQRFAESLPKPSNAKAANQANSELLAPADVIADVIELGCWQNIVYMVAAVCNSAAENSALLSRLVTLVSKTSIKDNSGWSLLYTRLHWALNDQRKSGFAQLLPLLTDLSFHWFQLLDNQEFNSLISSPERRLWQPIGTELTWKQVALFDCSLAVYERAAKDSRDLLAAFASFRPHVRSACEEMALLVASVVQMVRAVMSAEHLVELTRCSEELVRRLESGTNIAELSDQWIALVQQTTASVAGDIVSPAIEGVKAALACFGSSSCSLASVYRAWIQAGLCRLAISIPRRPVDPAAKARTQWAWLGDEIDVAQADLESYQTIQQTMTGERTTTAATKPFAQRLVLLEREQSAIELVYRPSKTAASENFAELWQEAHNLVANVLGRARDIAAQLVPDAYSPETFAMSTDEFNRVFAAAQAVLGTLSQFESRVVKRYFASFRDVAQIWCVQVRQVGYSLMRLVDLRKAQVNGQTVEYAALVNSLYAQPMRNVLVSSNGSNSLLQLRSQLAKLKTLVYFTPSGSTLKTYGQLLTALLSRVVLGVQVRGTILPNELAALNAVFSDALDIHKRAIDEKRKRDAEAASLFKSKVTREPTDEELLGELFPGFEDIYENADNEEALEDDREPSFQDLTDDVQAALAACHQYVMLQFARTVLGVSDVRRALILDAQRRAFELAASLYQLKPEIASVQTAGADVELRGANVVSLAAVAAATTATANAGASSESGVRMVSVYDFYKHPSTSEAVLLKPIVTGIIARAKFLLDEWPEHAVLQQILDMSLRLLEFPVTTPLAKLLAGLELLHQRAQDWQAFASKEVAIDELHDVARLIVRWRQAELNSWPHLLRAQELEFARRPNEWWFSLYASLVVPETADFSDLVAAIDQFMQGSPAGEFRGRLNMLCAFAGHRLSLLIAQSQERKQPLEHLQQSDCVYGPLTNAIDYYAQFAPCIEEHLERSGKPVRKDLAQYVKISSWKDVNPAALRASAQKTHRHLAKCVKMWREALSQPIFQIIQMQQAANIATARVALVQIVSLPLGNAGMDIDPPPSLASLSAGRKLSLPWTIAEDLGITSEMAAAVANSVSSTSSAMARVLEASPNSLQQLVKMMTRSAVFSSIIVEDNTSPDALEEFAIQVVSDINHFQNVETPKHLVKPAPASNASGTAKPRDTSSSKKRVIKSKKQREMEEEKAEEYVEDDEERQRRIKRFWGEQRNLRRTRLKEILKAMQEIGLKRHFRASETVSSADNSDKQQQQPAKSKASLLVGLSAMLQQAPLDVAAWHQTVAASLAVESSAVHMQTPQAQRNWQLANAGFFRLCSQLGQLRSATFEEHSQEINAQQVQQITGLMESLSHNVVKDRRCAAELLAQAASWMQASVGWTSTPAVSSSAVLDVEQLKDSVDGLVSLVEQFVVSARAVGDVGGWASNTALVGQAIGFVSSAGEGLSQASSVLAAAHGALVALKLSGTDSFAALVQVNGLKQTADAWRSVRDAVDATRRALDSIAESGLDPWVLGPWVDPIATAASQLASRLDDSSSAVLDAEEHADSQMAELAGQLATGTMNVWQAIYHAEKQFAEHDGATNQWGLMAKELVHRLDLMNQMARALHLPRMTELCRLLTQQASNSSSLQQGSMVHGFVRSWMTRYSLIAQHVVALYARWHRILVHFALTTTGVLTTVLVHGLGSNDVFDSEETNETMQNGMGVGEGSTAGAKNVSDEIESEDQVEGLQGEEPEGANEPQTNEDAIDMQNDFEGKLGDADLETDNEDSDRDDDDDDEEQEMDEQLGDVDPTDPTALDDKLWDDEKDDEQKDPKDEKSEDSKVDSKAKSKNDQTDIVAGDDEDDQKNNDPDTSGEQADEENNDENGSDGSDEEDGEDGEDLDDSVNRDTLDRMADVEDQGEQLDMPEDLDMGSDGSDAEQSDDDEDDGLDADMNELPEDEPIEQKPRGLDDEQDEKDAHDAEEDASKAQEETNDRLDQEEEAGQVDESAQDGADGEDAAMDEGDEQQQQEEEEEEADQDNKGDEEGANGEDAAMDDAEDAEESGANKPTDGVDSAMNLDGNDDADPNTAAESNEVLSKPSEASDNNRQQQQSASSAMQQEAFMQQDNLQQQQQQQQQKSDETQQRRELNPERTLADVIEKWERRLNLVMREKENEEQQAQSESTADDKKQKDDQQSNGKDNDDNQAAPESTDFEHVNQDEDFDKVALADADEHDKEQQQQQMQQLHQPMDIDEEEENHSDDVDDKDGAEDAEMDDADGQTAGANAAARPAAMQVAPQQLPATHADGESAAEAAQMQQSHAENDREKEADEEMDSDGEQPAADDSTEAVDVDQLRAELEQRTAEWRADKQGSAQAAELWQSYTRLTHDLSLMLTEQLRLILTPTQATQLRGDYRTGKRLNMKRIIPYIASEFRKDKIWLRRTKPARREYQVMVAVDNSKSMAQNAQAVELAYETLALVTTALNQLEVGQLSVVSFGEQVSLLHPFDSTFDSEAGARVLSRFTFADDKTDVVQLMDATLQLFDHAVTGASAADLWRLQLVISDGVCQDHPRLLRQVRAAMEMRIMTVFIVLDRSAIASAATTTGSADAGAVDPDKDSIMNTQHVSFVKGPAGKMEMRVQRYLDTFPFKYYVVLRNIHGLPAVLAETLRQYFSLVGSD